MTNLIITRGLPGCGKTTYARAWVAEDREHRARVNRDDIRAMLEDGQFVKGVTAPRVLAALRHWRGRRPAMGKTPQLGTTYICSHGRVSIPVWYQGKKRMRHNGPRDKDICEGCERFIERTARMVDLETALASLAGEDGDHDR